MYSAHGVDRRRDSLLRIKDVKKRTGLSVATVYRREAAKTFPRKIQIGPKCVAWYESDIDAWVADPLNYRAAEPEAASPDTLTGSRIASTIDP